MVDAIGPSDVHEASSTEDVIATALLGVAALASAYSGWQAALWGGVQSKCYNEASLVSAAGVRGSTIGAAEIAYDAATMVQLSIASIDHPAQVQLLKEHVIRREFKPYVEQWLAMTPFKHPDAPSTPFALPNYRNETLTTSHQLMLKSTDLFDRGNKANEHSDAFSLTTVTSTFVLFFAGIAPKLRPRSLRVIVLGFAIVAVGFAIYQLVQLPRA